MRTILLASLAIGLPLATVPLTASVITYDLTVDEDANAGNLNPDGVWTFLSGASVLSHTSIPASGSCFSGYAGLSSVYALNNVAGNCIPAFAVATGTGPGSGADFQTGDVIVHSQDNTNGSGNGQAFVTWTAPADGTITIDGLIWYAHAGVSRSNDFILTLGASTLSSGTVAFNSATGFNRANALSFNGGGSFGVSAGDLVSLEILRSSGETGGSIAGIDLKVTETTALSAVPEPSQIGIILLGGFAIAGTLLRRSRPR